VDGGRRKFFAILDGRPLNFLFDSVLKAFHFQKLSVTRGELWLREALYLNDVLKKVLESIFSKKRTFLLKKSLHLLREGPFEAGFWAYSAMVD